MSVFFEYPEFVEVLENSSDRGLEYWMTPGPPYWPGEPDRTLRAVGPEFFGTVLTRRLLAYAGSFGFSRADCIAYLRGQMSIEPYWYGTDDFYFLNSGAAAEDYESLMGIANSEKADPKARCMAIPKLVRFHRDRLQ